MILQQEYFCVPLSFLGITYKLFSVLFSILVASLIKKTSKNIPVGEAVLFSSCFALLVILYWFFLSSKLYSVLKIVSISRHLWREFIGTIAMLFKSLGVEASTFTVANGYWLFGTNLNFCICFFYLKRKIRLFKLVQ